MAESIRRYASIVIVAATFVLLVFFPAPWCLACEDPNFWGVNALVVEHRELIFEVWSISAIFLSTFLKFKRLWLIPLGIMIADLATQHHGGVPWWSLESNEGPVIIVVELTLGFIALGIAFLCRTCFERLVARIIE